MDLYLTSFYNTLFYSIYLLFWYLVILIHFLGQLFSVIVVLIPCSRNSCSDHLFVLLDNWSLILFNRIIVVLIPCFIFSCCDPLFYSIFYLFWSLNYFFENNSSLYQLFCSLYSCSLHIGTTWDPPVYMSTCCPVVDKHFRPSEWDN